MRRALGRLLGLVARAWIATLRIRVVEDPALAAVADRPWVLALWHGHQFALLGHARRRRTVALVSLSRDGELLAAAFPSFGLGVARGSSSRGGARGLADVIRRLRRGDDAAFAVDGPRGPGGIVRSSGGRVGAAIAAERTGGLVVPYAAACERSVRLSSWDRFELPLPFSRVAVALGVPITSGAGADEIARSIDRATDVAAASLGLVLAGAAHRATVDA